MKKILISLVCFFTILLSFQYVSPYFFSNNDTINLTIPHKIKTFDPALAFDDNSLNIISQSLDTLYQYHYLKRPYEIIPSLAQSMPKIENDGKKYIIKIRPNIRYHHHVAFNGERYLRAQDFVNGIKRLYYKPLKSVGRWIFENKIKGLNEFQNIKNMNLEQMLTTKIEGLTAVDEHTLIIELNRADPNILYYLAMYFTAPVPEELIRYYNNDLSKTLIGTGAYELKEVAKKYYLFEKNDHYRLEKYPSVGDLYANTQNLLDSSFEKIPFIKYAKFIILKTEDEIWNNFFEGNLDVINAPTKFLTHINSMNSDFQKDLSDKGIEVKHFSKLATRWIGFNMHNELIGKGQSALFLRKAIAHAIDFEKYIEVIASNTNLKANSILHPSIDGYRPGHKNTYEFNLTLAKKYLAFAGYPDGVGLPPLTFSSRGKHHANLLEANFIKDQLEKIGIKIEIQILKFADFIRLGRSAKLGHFWIDNWIFDYPDAENILQLLISKNYPGVNKSGVSIVEVDQLYEELMKTREKNKRLEIIYKIENIVYEQLPWIMLMYESSYTLQKKSVQNFRKSYFIKNNIKYLKLIN